MEQRLEHWFKVLGAAETFRLFLTEASALNRPSPTFNHCHIKLKALTSVLRRAHADIWSVPLLTFLDQTTRAMTGQGQDTTQNSRTFTMHSELLAGINRVEKIA